MISARSGHRHHANPRIHLHQKSVFLLPLQNCSITLRTASYYPFKTENSAEIFDHVARVPRLLLPGVLAPGHMESVGLTFHFQIHTKDCTIYVTHRANFLFLVRGVLTSGSTWLSPGRLVGRGKSKKMSLFTEIFTISCPVHFRTRLSRHHVEAWLVL